MDPAPLDGVALDALVHLPSQDTVCGVGVGLAVCPALGLLVTSEVRGGTLSVWVLPTPHDPDTFVGMGRGAGGSSPSPSPCGLALVSTLGGEGGDPALRFQFAVGGRGSGKLAFTPPASATACASGTNGAAVDKDGWDTGAGTGRPPHPLLIVCDAAANAVHLVDVLEGRHSGYLAPPGVVLGPCGVATCEPRGWVAVSGWPTDSGALGGHVVRLFTRAGPGWGPLPWVVGAGPGVLDGQLRQPWGVRFSVAGDTLAVADYGNGRVSLFRAGDGAFLGHVTPGGLSGPCDVEEVAAGWVAACHTSNTVEVVGRAPSGSAPAGQARGGGGPGERPTLGGPFGGGLGFQYPAAMALVPGLGLAVREWGSGGRLRVFATPDAVAMGVMAPVRVGWMVAVARGVLWARGRWGSGGRP
jgi:hypothetical protein